MDSLQIELNKIVLGLTKAVMKEQDRMEEFCEQPAALYEHLSNYFVTLMEEQTQAMEYGMEPKELIDVFSAVLFPALRSADFVHVPNEQQTSFDTSKGPYMPQKALKDGLQRSRAKLGAFPEVLEMCRFLDYLQSTTTPFGAVNVIHFTAVYLTLTRLPLYELIRLSWELLDEPIRLKVFHLWCLIDSTNREGLEYLINIILDHPHLTFPLLLEVYPQIQQIGTPSFVAPVMPSGQSDKVPTEVVYGEDDCPKPVTSSKGELSAPHVAPMPTKELTTSADVEGTEGLDDDIDEAAQGDRDFWNALVS
jgi:hypothetical protein